MQICRICEGNCDEGELVGGICHECRVAEQKKKRGELMERLLDSPSEQLRLIFDRTNHSAYRRRFGGN